MKNGAQYSKSEGTITCRYEALVAWQASQGLARGLSHRRPAEGRRRPTEDELFAVLNRHPWGVSTDGDALAEQLCRAIDESIPSLLLLGGSCQ